MAFQLLKDVTKQKQPKVNGIQEKNDNCLSVKEEIQNGWMDYWQNLYNYQSNVDSGVLSA